MTKKKQLRPKRKIITPKNCVFCDEKKDPWFSDVEPMQRFLTERGKIVARSRSGLCSKHQRHLTRSVKHARYLALLSYTSRD